MSRPGVSRQDVFSVANQLVEAGKDPTIEQIRQILKTGSNSTIAGHLRDWRALQNNSGSLSSLSETMPNEMLSMMKELWERLNVQAGEKVNKTEEKAQIMVDELQQELLKYKTNNHRWQQLFLRWQKEKEQLSNDKLVLEEVVASLQQDKKILLSKLSAQTEQLNEKRLRIEELHRLHLQIQTNLESERETMRKDRAQDQAQHKRQVEELQSEIKTQRETVLIHEEKISSLHHEYKTLQQTYNMLEITSQMEIDTQVNKVNELLKSITEHKQANEEWEKRHHEMQKDLNEKIIMLMDEQAKLNAASQQLIARHCDPEYEEYEQ